LRESFQVERILAALNAGTFSETILGGLSRTASLKWCLIGVAFVGIALRLFLSRTSSIVGTVLASSGLLLVAGSFVFHPLLQLGLALMGFGLLLLPIAIQEPTVDDSLDSDSACVLPQYVARKQNWLRALISEVGASARDIRDMVVAAVFLILLWVAWVEVHEPVVVVQPLVVPKSLEREGYSGQVLSRWLCEQIQALNLQASMPTISLMELRGTTNFPMPNFALREDDSMAKVSIPGAGVTLQSVLEPLRSAFGFPQDRVTGDIVTLDDRKVDLRVHARGKPEILVHGDIDHLSSLVETVSEELVGIIQPYVLGLFRKSSG
jgi:hypothetical protein